MANGFYMAQAQPIDYRGTAAAGGAPLAGLMGGVQQGMDMAQQARLMQMKEQEFQAQQQASQTAAAQEQQMNALAMQAAAGDPEAQQQLMALNPQAALQMQQTQGAQQEREIKQQEAQREAVGALGSLLSSSSKEMVDSTYERVVARVRKEGDHESEVGLPSREEWSKLSQKEKYDVTQKVGRQLQDFGMGPEAAAERRFKETEAERKAGKPDITALQKNLIAAGIKPGTPEFREAVLEGVKKGTVVNIGPQTESQRKDEFMADMVNSSLEEINASIGSDKFNPSGIMTLIGDKFGNIGNFVKSPEWQAFEGANDAVIEMYLNKITGAAYSELQKLGAEKRYKIRPGDTDKTIELKLKRMKDLSGMLNKSAGYAEGKPKMKLLTPEELEEEGKKALEEQKQTPVAAAAGDMSAMSNEELMKLYSGGQ